MGVNCSTCRNYNKESEVHLDIEIDDYSPNDDPNKVRNRRINSIVKKEAVESIIIQSEEIMEKENFTINNYNENPIINDIQNDEEEVTDKPTHNYTEEELYLLDKIVLIQFFFRKFIMSKRIMKFQVDEGKIKIEENFNFEDDMINQGYDLNTSRLLYTNEVMNINIEDVENVESVPNNNNNNNNYDIINEDDNNVLLDHIQNQIEKLEEIEDQNLSQNKNKIEISNNIDYIIIQPSNPFQISPSLEMQKSLDINIPFNKDKNKTKQEIIEEFLKERHSQLNIANEEDFHIENIQIFENNLNNATLNTTFKEPVYEIVQNNIDIEIITNSINKNEQRLETVYNVEYFSLNKEEKKINENLNNNITKEELNTSFKIENCNENSIINNNKFVSHNYLQIDTNENLNFTSENNMMNSFVEMDTQTMKSVELFPYEKLISSCESFFIKNTHQHENNLNDSNFNFSINSLHNHNENKVKRIIKTVVKKIIKIPSNSKKTELKIRKTVFLLTLLYNKNIKSKKIKLKNSFRIWKDNSHTNLVKKHILSKKRELLIGRILRRLIKNLNTEKIQFWFNKWNRKMIRISTNKRIVNLLLKKVFNQLERNKIEKYFDKWNENVNSILFKEKKIIIEQILIVRSEKLRKVLNKKKENENLIMNDKFYTWKEYANVNNNMRNSKIIGQINDLIKTSQNLNLLIERNYFRNFMKRLNRKANWEHTNSKIKHKIIKFYLNSGKIETVVRNKRIVNLFWKPVKPLKYYFYKFININNKLKIKELEKISHKWRIEDI